VIAFEKNRSYQDCVEGIVLWKRMVHNSRHYLDTGLPQYDARSFAAGKKARF
jgi:hypothetical protein